MAKKCPKTNKYVLYLECLECEEHGKCKKKNPGKRDTINVKH